MSGVFPATQLTLDDLEQLAFRYGGTVERDLGVDRYILRGALIDGRRVNLGPVPGPVRVEVAP